MGTLLLTLVLALAPSVGAGAATPGATAHDLHITYGNAAVEDALIVLRVRFFKDDLEAALGRHTGTSVLSMASTPEVDRVFLDYLAERLTVDVGGEQLAATVLASGSDLLDREPVWWYTLQFEADGPVTSLRVRNTLLFELFEDQRNVVKFVYFPDEAQKTYAFAHGEEEFVVEFGGQEGPTPPAIGNRSSATSHIWQTRL